MTDVTRLPSFQRWFGDSKVVDERGRPLVVYHGTPDARGLFVGGGHVGREGKWEPMADERPGFRRSPSRGMAFFAVDQHGMARTYADPRRAFDYQGADPAVVPLYLSIQNPLMVDAEGKSWRGTEHTVEEARSSGHDGVIILRSVDYYNNESKRRTPATVYVFFEPTQAKSALTGELLSMFDRKPIPGAGPNVGTFDPSDPDLTRNMQKNPPLDRFNFIEKTYYETQPWVVVDTLSVILPTIGIDEPREACHEAIARLVQSGEWPRGGAARENIQAIFSSIDGGLRPALARVVNDVQPGSAAITPKQAIAKWDEAFLSPEGSGIDLLFELIERPDFDERMREPHQADGIFPWVATQLSKLSKAVLQNPTLFVDYKIALRLLRKRGNAIVQWAKQNRVDVGKKTLAEVLEATADFKVTMGQIRQGRVDYTFADGWTIQELRSKRELQDEGKFLTHCVGGYCKDVESGKSQIFSLRDPDGIPVATAEWKPAKVPDSLSKTLSAGHFEQIFGAGNADVTDTGQIERFVEWIRARYPNDASGEMLLGIKVFADRKITLRATDGPDATIERFGFTRCNLYVTAPNVTFEHCSLVETTIHTSMGQRGPRPIGTESKWQVYFDTCEAPALRVIIRHHVMLSLDKTNAPGLTLQAANDGPGSLGLLSAHKSDVSNLHIKGDLPIGEIVTAGSRWNDADLSSVTWASISQWGKRGTTAVTHESFGDIRSSDGVKLDPAKIPAVLRGDDDEGVDESEFADAMDEMDDEDYGVPNDDF